MTSALTVCACDISSNTLNYPKRAHLGSLWSVCFVCVIFFSVLLTCGASYLLCDGFCHLGTLLNQICKLILSWGFSLCAQKA